MHVAMTRLGPRLRTRCCHFEKLRVPPNNFCFSAIAKSVLERPIVTLYNLQIEFLNKRLTEMTQARASYVFTHAQYSYANVFRRSNYWKMSV